VLRTPSYRKRGWRDELNFGMDARAVQTAILGGEPLAEGNWMTMRALFVGDAALAREVLVSQADAFEVSNPPHFKYVLGEQNIGLLQEPAHSTLRAALMPAFLPARLAASQPRLEQVVKSRISEWARAGKVLRWDSELRLLTFQVMVEVIGGFNLDDAALRALADDFAAISAGLAFPVPLALFGLTPFGKAMNARRRVEALLRRTCEDARAQPNANASLLADMLSALDGEGQPLSEKALADNFIGLFIAGHDTTASSLSVALFYLSQTPAALAALRQEQAEVVSRHGDAVSPTALEAMPYAEAVLREAWRLHPVVPVVGRQATRDVTLGDFLVKDGQRTFVAINTVTSGRAGAWKDAADADAFYPERWLAGSPGGAAAAAAQMPFGAGKRACLGAGLAWAEAKTVLALVARRLCFSVDAESARWSSFPFPQVAMDMTCTPAQPQSLV
jgi:cytochrome P450